MEERLREDQTDRQRLRPSFYRRGESDHCRSGSCKEAAENGSDDTQATGAATPSLILYLNLCPSVSFSQSLGIRLSDLCLSYDETKGNQDFKICLHADSLILSLAACMQ